MKTSTRLAAIVALAGPAAAHIHLPFAGRSTHGPPDAAAAAARLQRRSASSSAPTTHVDTSYSSSLVNLTVGTPPQDVALLLSVDDYVTWVPDATYCADEDEDDGPRYRRSARRCDYGAFNVNLSSSWARDRDGDGYDRTFDAGSLGSAGRYTAGNYASGRSLRETVGFAGAAVPNVTLGLASSADLFVGLLGLGFNESERSYADHQRPAFLDSMLAAGLVATKAYSVWLDDDEAGSAGHLLLGAVDRSAFTPPLVRYDMGGSGGSSRSSGYGYGDSISIDVASVNTSATADGPLAPFQNKTRLPTVNIDPFGPLSYLPGPLAKATWDLAGAVWDEDTTWATIPCSARADAQARLAVQFGDGNGPVVSLPVSDLVLPADPWYAASYGRSSAGAPADTCVFGIQSPDYDPDEDEANFYSASASSSASASTTYVAGAALLRRAYVVLDLANKELALAPVKFGAPSTPADVVSFAGYGALMPESTSHRCLSDNAYYSDNCTGEYAGTGPGSHSGSGYSGDGDDDSFGGLGKGQVIGLIVGLSIVGLTMLAVAIWGIIRCTRDNRKYSAEAMKEAQIGGGEPAFGSSAPAPAAAQSQPTTAAPP